ncbi:MAG: bifunctional YncE family protein/alkaline phosphatase family protein [Williamsia sp.]|nr:bifunctional YncE family protein/alkaline phosphatase family protein [Williamsia sp.]
MKMSPVKAGVQSICLLGLFVLVGCTAARKYTTTVTRTSDYHSSYDDTTLSPLNSTVLMPYNRFIDPAGTVIRFGNKQLENHSLDCALLPGGKVLAVEDRFGLAFIDATDPKLLFHLDYGVNNPYRGFISTYSGMKVADSAGTVHVFWSASNTSSKRSYVFDAMWDGKKAVISSAMPFEPVKGLSALALPNDICVALEGGEMYLFVVLNGNNQLVKLRWRDKKIIWTAATGMAPYGAVLIKGKIYVSNWAGPVPAEGGGETAGIPYARVYVDPLTGATAQGTLSVFDAASGQKLHDIRVGLHPNDVIASPDEQFLYVANANSDHVSVISTGTDAVVDSIPVQLNKKVAYLIGDSPNALAIDATGTTLYVANGLDNAIAVIKLGERVSTAGKGSSTMEGFIPTEAYPAGMALSSSSAILYVANLEGEGARVRKDDDGTYNSHRQEATVSIIPVPDKKELQQYTTRVEKANMVFRTELLQRLPRNGISAKPVPERIGEPSVFKHVFYIIKENRTYDQILGDMPQGDGMKAVCIYGDSITPNHHRLAREFLLMDNYYVSGKSSAEGHQWTDAAMVTDYIERNVQAWFNSYPHVQTDAMVYNKKGFIWNNALDHGKTVRIYGEACIPQWEGKLTWKDIWGMHKEARPFNFKNVTTISRVQPLLAPTYPGYDGQTVNDQVRADAFIKELNAYEKMPGDQLPQLIIMALPSDHTAGMREGYPRPEAMVADNDLALGRILEAITHSRFWDSTAVFVTEDDSQGGWDHVSAYRTVGFVMSPYSRLQRTVHTNYNQTCVVRTIEQILGLPPMNVVDATALPMFDCFSGKFDKTPYTHELNKIPLDLMNKAAAALSGKAKEFTVQSGTPQFDHVDGGNDDLLNRILWFAARGDRPYPRQLTLPRKLRKADDDD